MREVIDLRLARLSDACVRLLTVAAVIGMEFQFGPLEQVSDLQGEDFAAALDEALAADVVLESDHGTTSRSPSRTRWCAAPSSSGSPAPTGAASTPGWPKRSRPRAATPPCWRSPTMCEARPVSDREDALDYATRGRAGHGGLGLLEAVDLFTRARLLLPPTTTAGERWR